MSVLGAIGLGRSLYCSGICSFTGTSSALGEGTAGLTEPPLEGAAAVPEVDFPAALVDSRVVSASTNRVRNLSEAEDELPDS